MRHIVQCTFCDAGCDPGEVPDFNAIGLCTELVYYYSDGTNL